VSAIASTDRSQPSTDFFGASNRKGAGRKPWRFGGFLRPTVRQSRIGADRLRSRVLADKEWCKIAGLRRLYHSLDRITLELQMQKFTRMAVAAAAFLCLPAGVSLAQTTPTTETGTPATPPAATAPATAPATTAPSATATDAKKKKTTKQTRQQEIDKSVNSGTVPSRYRKDVPKEYQQYIPFSK
jgi:hypothetical protein